MAPDTDNYSVKELISLFVIPALDDLRTTAEARDKQYTLDMQRHDDRFSKLEAWRDKGIGAVAVIASVLVPVAMPVIITILTAGLGAVLILWG